MFGETRIGGTAAKCMRVALAAAAWATGSDALATAQRTFVASYGDDANPCSILQPCRSFGAAIAQTNPEGEIIVRDSAGYGIVNVTKSVSIIAPTGVYAGISVFSGQTGVLVNVPAGLVVLRGLTINGQGGSIGVLLNAAAELRIEHCVVSNFVSSAISANVAGGTVLFISHTAMTGSSSGLSVMGAGRVNLDRTRAEGNSAFGVSASNGVEIAIRNSVLARNATGLLLQGSPGNVVGSLEASEVFSNGGLGVRVNALGSSTASLVIADSAITRNGATASPHHGVQVTSSATSVARATLDRARVSYNFGDGVSTSGAGAVAYVGFSVIDENLLYAFNAVSSSTIYTRQNNTVHNNFAGPTNGNVQFLGGI